ncbi:MAG: hypothetical protein S4CHLAM45_05590 [Chlamydiales bacterium]|nr:hypothetical protein [Chlamydiales bacterium]MCH9619900.1 hypothetical protein [Chlamydiales bacterium]MCH9622673.1 hypothetical protein [Chlamydiales bacterium]
MLYRVILFIAAVLFLPCHADFQVDYAKALEQGCKEKKPLLLFFNGSDWSGLGMKMKNEIFLSSEFKKELGDRLICVELDFPKHHEIDSAKQLQNRKLKEQYQIREFPSLVMIDSSERVILQFGYLPESGTQFAQDLLRFIDQDRQLIALLEQIDSLKESGLQQGYGLAVELQQESAIDAFLVAGSKCESPAFFLIQHYRRLVEEGREKELYTMGVKDRLLQLDPNNSQGYLFSLALIDFQSRSRFDSTLSVEEVIKPLKEYLAMFGEKDQENRWRVEMMIAQFYLEHDELNSALKHAEIAYKLAPTEKQGEMNHSLRYIKEQASQLVNAR